MTWQVVLALCRVFVGGMPFSYEEEAIREYWSFCGEIEGLDIVRFPDTGRFKVSSCRHLCSWSDGGASRIV